MTRFSMISAICLTGAFVTLVATIDTAPDKLMALNAERNEKISDMLVSYYCFENTKTTTVELLAKGQISLVEACDLVLESATRHHPDYLTNIEISDPAPTAQERIARNLIGHLRSNEGDGRVLSSRVQALELELAVLH